MPMLSRIKKIFIAVILLSILSMSGAHALDHQRPIEEGAIDRIHLVTEQINLLKTRLTQGENELANLQQDEQISQLALEKASKNLLDKASLDVLVAKSNLDSINIEYSDSQQTCVWIEKNIQEIENQLNVLNIFGLKVAANEAANVREYYSDLTDQKKLLQLEKVRGKYLQRLQDVASNILAQKTARYNRLSDLLKSRKMLTTKQQQVKDELAYQEQQNHWLQQLNIYYARLAKIDPGKSKADYAALERDIFYANENGNYTYIQSLLARYKDQIQQTKNAVFKTNSITLLTEISSQIQTISKQINRLDTVQKSRLDVLEKHINYLMQKKKNTEQFATYLKKLSDLKAKYKVSEKELAKLNLSLAASRKILDKALQDELSARQGFPTFGLKMLLDLGKEMLLVPALTFQVIKSLSTHFVNAFRSAGIMVWSFFIVSECLLLFAFFFVRKLIHFLLDLPSQWRNQINSKWLSLQYLKHNLLDILLIGNAIAIMYFFEVPQQHVIFVFYLSLVWLVFKGILTVLRACLVETTTESSGHDVRLYHRLKWIILIGGLITALTVFVHQLPLIFELKTLCDRLFLFQLLIISLLLLRSWDVFPNLILSNMESQHPYLRKSIRLIGILVPLLLFGNSIIGLLGFVNLVMTISWYEAVFLMVLIVYLVLRGLLSDGMEQASRVMIQYANNGWLLTEAFLKPLDKVLQITLFLMTWAVLFLLYGWDKQSPIVERLTKLLHYHLINLLNTTITPIHIIELFVVISIFYWTAKWTREFVYRLLVLRIKDMSIRNSVAILSQYSVVILGIFICLRVLGIDLRALTFVASMLAFGVGLGLRDLANNFASGFLLLFERPLRVGDIVNIGEFEGEVMDIGSRAVTIRTWDHTELVVPNAEIFSKSFTNWTAKDNIVRSTTHINISRYDNPHEVKMIIQNVLLSHKDILKDPAPDVLLKEMNDTLMQFELRYYVNIRQVKSKVSVMSVVLMNVWDAFAQHGIKPPYPQHEIYLKNGKDIGNASSV